jgi:hypothetical protein
MSGGGTQQQTTTQTNEPYAASRPLYNYGMNRALDMAQSGDLFRPNTTSTVVPWAQQTMQGMTESQRLANRNMGDRGLSGQAQGNIQRGGMTGTQYDAFRSTNPFASGARGIDASGILGTGMEAMNNPGSNTYARAQSGGMDLGTINQGNIYRGATGPSYSERNLSDVASGQMLGGNNPYLEDYLSDTSQRTAEEINLATSGMGRYGSGTHTGVLADRIGALQLGERSANYERERERQMQANQMLDSQRMAGLGMGLNAANSISGIQSGNRDTRLQGAQMGDNAFYSGLDRNMQAQLAAAGIEQGNLNRQYGAITDRFNMGQQGFNNLGANYDLQRQPIQDMYDIGSMNEDLYGRVLNDRLRIQNETQNQEQRALEWLNSIAGGAGQFGTSTSTAQMPGQNPFLTGLGYASGGLGLLGNLF